MREIIFRGKTVKGEWIYGSLVTTTIGNTKTWIVASARGQGGWFNVMKREYVYPETVGQYTSFENFSNQKVFEGDILDFTIFDHEGSDYQYVGVVKWLEDGWIVEVNDEVSFELWHVMQDHEVVIIGNIHDNPEILKS